MLQRGVRVGLPCGMLGVIDAVVSEQRQSLQELGEYAKK
jgi:hypothetical protein